MIKTLQKPAQERLEHSILALAVAAVIYGMGLFFAWAFEDMAQRMDAVSTACEYKGGALIDTSSGFICVGSKGVQK